MKTLNKAQIEAVEHTGGPMLIVAGAGTGKTTVLIERLDYLIKNKLARAEEVLIITFTEKAAAELEERADVILPYGYVDLWINTFHGFCQRLLADHALDIGLPGDFKVLTQTEQWMFLRKHLDEFNLDYYRPLGNPTKFLHELIKHFSKLKDEAISSQDYLEYAEQLQADGDGMLSGGKGQKSKVKSQNYNSKIKNSPLEGRGPLAVRGVKDPEAEEDVNEMEIARIQELANAYHTYNQLLLKEGFLDFGDLIAYALKLFKERPNILKYYQEHFKYIMVDEFQDTNWAQYELIKLLANKSPLHLKEGLGGGYSPNLMVVGDDNQSVYKFRGASLSNIMQFKDDYPDAKTVVLNDNYRSGQNILDISYDFIKYNDPNTLEAKLGISKKLKSHSEDKGEAQLLSFSTELNEVKGVADKIIELYEAQADTKWSDFAILVRANDTAVSFINELTKRGIPNLFVSLRGLYYKPIILDCLAYLRLLDNYHESSALFRVLNFAAFRVPYKDIIEINKFAKKKVWSSFEALKNIGAITRLAPDTVVRVHKLVALIEKHTELARKEKASSVFVKIIRELSIIDHLDKDKDIEIFDQLNQFYNHIKNYENSDTDFKVKDLLVSIAMEMEAGETGSLKLTFDDDDKVKIMTAHASKGLEFKYVFIVGMVDKRFPTIQRKDKIPVPDALVKEFVPEGDTHVEEERRLFYVAMTRAKQGLFLTYAEDYGGATVKKPSKFLLEAGLGNPLSGGVAPKGRGGSLRSTKFNLFDELNERDKTELDSPQKIFLPARFSFSQIEAYTKCPLQYKFAFVLKIPAEDKPSLNFGRVMHNTLRQFFSLTLSTPVAQGNLFAKETKQEKRRPIKEDLLNIYEDYWIPDGYRTKDEREKYYKLGKVILKDFYDKLESGEWPEVAYLEKNFNFKIGGYVFKGAIDRIDKLSDGTYEITDYKTGTAKDKVAYENKRQLILYKLATESLFQVKVSKLTFYYLENNSKVSFEAKDKDLEKLQAQILETIDKIKSCNFTPTPGMICDWCDFNTICEFRK